MRWCNSLCYRRAAVLTLVIVFLCLTVLPGIPPLQARENNKTLLRMGFIYQADIQDTVTRYQPLFNYLEKHLPLRITPVWYDNGYQLMVDLNQGFVDLVLADGTMYIYAREKLNANQIAVMKVKGKFSRRAVVVVRRDSGIKDLEDLRGKRMALVGPFDELSTLWVRSELEGMGETVDGFFHTAVNTLSFEASILNTVLKEVDAAAAEESVFIGLRNINPKIRETLEVIKRSPPYSNLVIIAGKAVDPTFIRKIRSVLVTMDNSLEGNAVLASIHCDGFYPKNDGLFVNDRALMRFFPQVE